MIASVKSGVDVKAKYAFHFLLMTRNYKLSPYLDAAYKAANPNQFEKTLLRRTRK
jgi:hypothetical protein